MLKHIFDHGSHVIEAFGPPLIGKRKTLVSTRAIKGPFELFHTSAGELRGESNIDLVVVPMDGSPPYPCKISIFHESWVETEPGSGIYRRSAVSKIVPIPEGHEVVLKTLEGDEIVRHPDFVAIGVEGEVYANSADWVAANLEFQIDLEV
jgi:hypothetical protein